MENTKIVEVNGRKFKLKKYDARTGSLMVIKVIGILSPVLSSIDLKSLTNLDTSSINLTQMMSGLTDLSDKDFDFIQSNCLKKCFEILPAGEAQVLTQEGKFGIIGAEEDVPLVMALTVHSLVFNFSGFFSGSLLGLFQGVTLNTSQQNS